MEIKLFASMTLQQIKSYLKNNREMPDGTILANLGNGYYDVSLNSGTSLHSVSGPLGLEVGDGVTVCFNDGDLARPTIIGLSNNCTAITEEVDLSSEYRGYSDPVAGNWETIHANNARTNFYSSKNIFAGTELWNNGTHDSRGASMSFSGTIILAEGLIIFLGYRGAGGGSIYAYDINTGSLKWCLASEIHGENTDKFYSPPSYKNGYLYSILYNTLDFYCGQYRGDKPLGDGSSYSPCPITLVKIQASTGKIVGRVRFSSSVENWEEFRIPPLISLNWTFWYSSAILPLVLSDGTVYLHCSEYDQSWNESVIVYKISPSAFNVKNYTSSFGIRYNNDGSQYLVVNNGTTLLIKGVGYNSQTKKYYYIDRSGNCVYPNPKMTVTIGSNTYLWNQLPVFLDTEACRYYSDQWKKMLANGTVKELRLRNYSIVHDQALACSASQLCYDEKTETIFFATPFDPNVSEGSLIRLYWLSKDLTIKRAVDSTYNKTTGEDTYSCQVVCAGDYVFLVGAYGIETYSISAMKLINYYPFPNYEGLGYGARSPISVYQKGDDIRVYFSYYDMDYYPSNKMKIRCINPLNGVAVSGWNPSYYIDHRYGSLSDYSCIENRALCLTEKYCIHTFEPSGGEIKVNCLDVNTGAVVWATDTVAGDYYHTAPVIDGEHIAYGAGVYSPTEEEEWNCGITHILT